MSKICLISVIIPVKNGEMTLERCLSAIENQTLADNIDIIILDSCSTDKSVEIASSFGARIVNIPNGTFNHGLTRNEGVKYAKGSLLYFTVQDAYLAEDNQLEKMAALFADQELQAVVGMQAIPGNSDKNPARWFRRMSTPVTTFYQYSLAIFSRLSFKEKLAAAGRWDNVNAMYRKTALEMIPFMETEFAEDKFWAISALQAGYKIAFDPSLVVYHYHHYDFKYAFKVEYIINYNYYKYLRILPDLPAFVTPLLTSLYRIWKNETISFVKKIYWSFHNLSGLSGNFYRI